MVRLRSPQVVRYTSGYSPQVVRPGSESGDPKRVAPQIALLANVTVARAARPVLTDINLTIHAGDRILVTGDNGAGKSSLLSLLAGRLHPHGSAGRREYGWDHTTGADFRSARKHIGFVSREEQHRLQRIHGSNTLRAFVIGHTDAQDFLYREETASDRDRADELIKEWGASHLSGRRLKTLSLGEMRLAMIVCLALHARQLYLLDEIFTGLSPKLVSHLARWIGNLNEQAAVVMTSHDTERLQGIALNRHWLVADGRVAESTASMVPLSANAETRYTPKKAGPMRGEWELIACKHANFYHDFTCIFSDLSFTLHTGDRILLTGPNGAGKSTLLRLMHGDFYPEFGSISPTSGGPGSLHFFGPLKHEIKSELWGQVQIVAASHFTYYPTHMSVQDVLASRLSGSIYDYPDTLPEAATGIVAQLGLTAFLARSFIALSEGEKTRVLLARAFMLPAPVYLIDEGFIALSAVHFAAAIAQLNRLPASAAVVIAANERIADLRDSLDVRPADWQLALEQLAGALVPRGEQSSGVRLTILP